MNEKKGVDFDYRGMQIAQLSDHGSSASGTVEGEGNSGDVTCLWPLRLRSASDGTLHVKHQK